MSFLDFIFGKPPYPPGSKNEVNRLIEDLAQIGKKEDFLSERPGGPFNAQCRHIRAREIGARLNQIGGIELMEFVLKKIRKRLTPNLAAHLSYAWSDIGAWIP